jgi:hypothetical protein
MQIQGDLYSASVQSNKGIIQDSRVGAPARPCPWCLRCTLQPGATVYKSNALAMHLRVESGLGVCYVSTAYRR